jgi:hypothetical protein
MSNGKRGIAPCGHPGTYITNSFVTCDQRCEFENSDGVPEHVAPERTQPICPFIGCPGGGVTQWPNRRSRNGEDFWMCDACGRSFYA